jgi:hypothetical protein
LKLYREQRVLRLQMYREFNIMVNFCI